MRRILQFVLTWFVCVLWVTGPGVEVAQAKVKVELTNDVDAKGSCLGLGTALVGRCVSRAETQGLVRVSEVGSSGLTVGTNGAEDRVVTAVATELPAAAAEIVRGDRVVSVDGEAGLRRHPTEYDRPDVDPRTRPHACQGA